MYAKPFSTKTLTKISVIVRLSLHTHTRTCIISMVTIVELGSYPIEYEITKLRRVCVIVVALFGRVK